MMLYLNQESKFDGLQDLISTVSIFDTRIDFIFVVYLYGKQIRDLHNIDRRNNVMARTKKVVEVAKDLDDIVPTFEESHPGESLIDAGPEVDASGRKKKVTVTHEELEAKGLKNKSQVIRYLDSEGFSRSAIAGFLNVRYQHVRNVLITPLKKG